MNTTFARILHLLTTLERHYGLSGLDAEQRAIFDFIVQRTADGQSTTSHDVVAAKLTSRSSTYRHLATLRQSGLICDDHHEGQNTLTVTPKFGHFVEQLAQLPLSTVNAD
jgi:DNA-binding transcriptional ArsR family regulator